MGEFRDFFHGFPGVVLPECPLAGGMRLRYVLGREGFTHRDQRNVTRVPPRGLRGPGDARAHGLQVGGDCGHNFRIAPRWRPA